MIIDYCRIHYNFLKLYRKQDKLNVFGMCTKGCILFKLFSIHN